MFVLVERDRPELARAIQYARTLTPDDLRAVHIAIDHEHAESWPRSGRDSAWRASRSRWSSAPTAHQPHGARGGGRGGADGQTEVTVLIPRREYRRFWHRFLHDRTADSIAKTLADVPHANVTFVPYHLGTKERKPAEEVTS